ncbi:MAG: hypothetical protein RLZ12_269 [Bacillota bacterium]
MSYVVILNGPSSSGKTSIAKQLQDIMDDPYILLGLDNIIYTIPDKMNDYKEDLKPRNGFGWKVSWNNDGEKLQHLTPGTFGVKMYQLLKEQVKLFTDHGVNVIVDQVSLIDDDYVQWTEKLVNHKLVVCGVTADDKILEQREVDRGDRVIGGSRAQQLSVHNGFQYDLLLDTSILNPLECATKIKDFINNT